jgi:hypothetical protein
MTSSTVSWTGVGEEMVLTGRLLRRGTRDAGTPMG